MKSEDNDNDGGNGEGEGGGGGGGDDDDSWEGRGIEEDFFSFVRGIFLSLDVYSTYCKETCDHGNKVMF